jgi:hypothetical protein
VLEELPEVPEVVGSASHPAVAMHVGFVRLGGMSCNFGSSPGM